MPLTPVLIGMDGFSSGEHFLLNDGQPSTIGRSSTCEICLQKLPRYLAISESQRPQLTEFNVISRRHVTLTVTGSMAHLENHSASGTWCDDARFDKSKEVDLAIAAVTLRLGAHEVFQLRLLDGDELERLCTRTTPLQIQTTRITMDHIP
jgi:hypothetical protein